MFEKEAEEYRKDLKSKFFLSEPQLDLACQGFKDGLRKANEWHYPSKGEYPKEDKRYLCKIKAFVGGGINYECFDYDTEYGSWKNACGDVIAWKEIVLPELKESK